ncbi:hypothetical protein H2200_013289 [Cladophialophora chaetospira]|uniref:Major facilitator superfamily (MFS) profile domain-containing protein n=1 Tax=Cladophialophora chaetospira TaxID=386627 RepID=A0AA38WW08_9EURO|nr:hypothetical protein H2200_013289 [Cladophialophora chaetospira]
MQSPIYDLTFAALHGFVPLDDEPPSISTDRTSEDVSDTKYQTQPPRSKSFWWIFGSFCLSEFARAVDAVILPVILPGIVVDLAATTTQGYMSGSSFLLCQTIFQQVYAGLSQVLGNKTCMIAALLIFAGASVLTGLAKTPVWIIGARALQGAGAGGMDLMCNLITTDMVPLTRRGKYSGLLQLFGAAGMVAGMIFASGIEAKLSWRWVFFVNPFLVAAPLIILTIFFHSKPRKGDIRTHLKTVDWSGMLLVSLSCASVLYGFLAGGAIYPWGSAHVLVPIVLGTIGVVLFILHQAFFVQRYTSAETLIPLRLFKHRTSATGYAVTVLHSILLAAFVNFFFIYLSVLKTSLTLLPSSCLTFTCAAIAGVVTGRIKRYRIFVVIGGVLLTAGYATFIHLRENASRVEQLFIQLPFALGAGVVLPARLLATQAAQHPQDMPQAAATMTFLFNLGQCFGIPIGAATYQWEWDRLVKKDVASGLIPTQYIITSHDAEESGELIKEWPKAVSDAYRHIMAVSISKLWIVTTVISGVILLLGILMKEVPLRDRGEPEPLREEKDFGNDDTDRLIIS